MILLFLLLQDGFASINRFRISWLSYFGLNLAVKVHGLPVSCISLDTNFGRDWLAHLLHVRQYSQTPTVAAVASNTEGPLPHKQVQWGVVPLTIPQNQFLISHLKLSCYCTWIVTLQVARRC
jgi:hypothetical protein